MTPRPGADPDVDARAVGTIADFLTNASYHPDGIKVRLSTGVIGRVTRVLEVPAADADVEREDEDEEDDDDDEDEGGADDDDPTRAATNARATNSEETVAVRTAHVANVPKSVPKAEVKKLAEGLPGVLNVRVPLRAGGHMGFMFIECVDGDAVKAVIAKLNGFHFHGATLDAAFAKSDPKPKLKKAKATTGSEPAPAPTEIKSKQKSKQKAEKPAETAETAAERKARARVAEAERRILHARASMEADAVLELERARRKREREQKAIEEQEAIRRAIEDDRERRARDVIEQRRVAAERRAARARADADARVALERRARELGEIDLPPSWLADVRVLRQKIDAIRIDAERP